MKNLKFCFVDKTISAQKKEILRPKRGSALASGLDLVSALESSLVIKSKDWALVGTGIAISLPAGFEAQVRSRSGLALKHGIMVLNSPGTIDADYRGEIKVIVANMGKEDFIIDFGMRIAQLIICPVLLPELQEYNDIDESLRGEQGFGSTGKFSQAL
jgi:dUTP pyrophosphatase